MQSIGHDRREFIAKSFCLVGAAGFGAFDLLAVAAQAQTPPRPIRRSDRYDNSFITERKPFKWPGNNTLAVWFAPNVEVWQYNSAFGVGISPNPTNYVPDVFNYAWREYGIRVGLWRIADVFDAAGVKATVALNSQVCDVFPKAIEEMKKRGWEFMGHGATNSNTLAGLAPEQERDTIRAVLKTIEQATGKRPRGWLGPGLIETHNTLDILAEEGVQYCGDWNNDDQPYPMKVKSGKMFSIPYCNEINDIPLFIRKGYTGEQYLRSVYRSIRCAARRQQQATPRHGRSAASDDHRSTLAHQVSGARHRPYEGAARRMVRHRQRDHRRLPELGVRSATPNWICVTISPEVGASPAAETRRVRAALYGFAAPANSAGDLSAAGGTILSPADADVTEVALVGCSMGF